MISPSVTPLDYVYLVSCEHSGSTLIACLLGAHPEISGVGEFGTVWNPQGRCSCGANYCECTLWQRWKQECEARGLTFTIGDLGVGLSHARLSGRLSDAYLYQLHSARLTTAKDRLLELHPKLRKAREEAVSRSVELARTLLDIEGTRVFADTTKSGLQIRFLSRCPDVRLKMIALTRDGRGVMKSLMTREGYTRQQAIDAWIWSVRNLEAAAAHCEPDQVLRIRLENLCQNPTTEIKRLYSFCGVDPEVAIEYDRLSERHIIGNSMRLSFDGEIRAPDESWREKLSREDLDEFERQAGDLNRALGHQDVETNVNPLQPATA